MKREILDILKEHKGEYLSGEVLSNRLGVSRTAVWKHIVDLRKAGYTIDSSSKKGYVLMAIPDILDPDEISSLLSNQIIGNKILCYPSIDSTNNSAKKAAAEGCEEGTVVIAETQTSGRGRLGRLWDSSGQKGIWMSVVLKPEITPEEVQMITLAASVAVVKAVKKVTGIETGIKWPNDIILDGKKLCGILTEMNTEMERVNYLVLGIGLNVNHNRSDFPEELWGKAISLKMFEEEKSSEAIIYKRNVLIASILFELEQKYSKIKNGMPQDILEEWKNHSVTIGKEIRAISRNEEFEGVAVDIGIDGKLAVRCKTGIIREISSGEISVRGVMGYV